MHSFGPLYCETPATEGTPFPVEPVNTWTNAPTIFLGLIALYLVFRYTPKVWSLSILGVLIFATGVGSTLWHGFRTPLFLSLDVLPGLLAFFVIAFLWPTYLYGRSAGYATIALLAGMVFLTVRVGLALPYTPFLIPMLFAAVLCAILTFLTFRRYGNLGWWGIGTFLLAGSAAVFRTIDLSVCNTLPFGTHFLWHIFLGAGAFCTLLLFLSLEKRR